jgi:hypothetical protein
MIFGNENSLRTELIKAANENFLITLNTVCTTMRITSREEIIIFGRRAYVLRLAGEIFGSVSSNNKKKVFSALFPNRR